MFFFFFFVSSPRVSCGRDWDHPVFVTEHLEGADRLYPCRYGVLEHA